MNLILLFVFFCIIGFVYEFLIFDKKSLTIPYGICGVLLYIIYKTKLDIISKILLSFIIINIAECILGKLSYLYHNRQTWKYSEDMYPLCGGYISVITGIYWTFLSYIVFIIFEKLGL